MLVINFGAMIGPRVRGKVGYSESVYLWFVLRTCLIGTYWKTWLNKNLNTFLSGIVPEIDIKEGCLISGCTPKAGKLFRQFSIRPVVNYKGIKSVR